MERAQTMNRLKGSKTASLVRNFLPVPTLEKAVQPVRTDFAAVPTEKGFDWNRIGRAAWHSTPKETRKDEKYLVVFRSTRSDQANIGELVRLEDQARDDARDKGLLVYFPGPITDSPQNVSFCLWESAEQAWSVSHRDPHTEAVDHAISPPVEDRPYTQFDAEKYVVRTRRTKLGRLRTTLTRVEQNPAAPVAA